MASNANGASNHAQKDALARTKRWWFGLLTKSVFVTCVAVYVATELTGLDALILHTCLSPYRLAAHVEIWRAVTAPLVHLGLLHIVFNMLAYVPMARSVESSVGTVRFAYLTLVCMLATAIVHASLAWLAHGVAVVTRGVEAYPQSDPLYDAAASVASKGSFYVLRMLGGVHACSAGLSAQIFVHIAYEPYFEGGTRGERSVFGLFNVPVSWYPWVLLVLFQLMIPNASLLGHLSGLLVGLALGAVPLFGTVAHLTHATSTRVEAKLPSRIRDASGFVSSPGVGWSMSSPLPTTTADAAPSSSSWWTRMTASTSSSTTPAFAGTARTLSQQSSSAALPWARSPESGGGGTYATLPNGEEARAAAAAAAAARAAAARGP